MPPLASWGGGHGPLAPLNPPLPFRLSLHFDLQQSFVNESTYTNMPVIIIIIFTKCKAKPDCSQPGYPPSRLLIIVNCSVIWFACIQRSTCTSCRTPPSTECYANPFLWIGPGLGRQHWLPWQCPCVSKKTDFRSFIYNHSSN